MYEHWSLCGFLFFVLYLVKEIETRWNEYIIQATCKSRNNGENKRTKAQRNVKNCVTIVEIFQSCTEPPSSWCSTNGSFRHSDSSLYPDSLNQETSSVTGTTRVEFIIGSPTRRFRQSSVWPHRYFDSIDSAAIPESLLTDEFSLRRGEALAECDSLECHPISNESWIAEMSFVVWPK